MDNKTFITSDHFDELFNTQLNLQKRLNPSFGSDQTLKEISDFWLRNMFFIDRELGEMVDALGGEKDGIGNAVWKDWKKDHQKASDMKISDLSEEDLKALKVEIVDAFHFFMNFPISIGMTGTELYNMYIEKNKINHRRQDEGY